MKERQANTIVATPPWLLLLAGSVTAAGTLRRSLEVLADVLFQATLFLPSFLLR